MLYVSTPIIVVHIATLLIFVGCAFLQELRKLVAASGLDAVLHFTVATETVFKRGSEMKNSQQG